MNKKCFIIGIVLVFIGSFIATYAIEKTIERELSNVDKYIIGEIESKYIDLNPAWYLEGPCYHFIMNDGNDVTVLSGTYKDHDIEDEYVYTNPDWEVLEYPFWTLVSPVILICVGIGLLHSSISEYVEGDEICEYCGKELECFCCDEENVE